MPVDFEPETDLDAFQEKLKDAIEQDDRNKALVVAGIVGAVFLLAAIAVIVTFNVLKSYAGSYMPSGPININPCKVGAYVNVGNVQCVYVPCAVTDSQGNLAKGFYATQEDCLASFQSYFYPAAGQSPQNVPYGYCTQTQGATAPPGWTAANQYVGLESCQVDMLDYNKNVAMLGVKCDPVDGSILCTNQGPSDTVCPIANNTVLENPLDISGYPCTLYSGCAANQCAQQYSTSVAQGPGGLPTSWTNITNNGCTGGYDPCNQQCPTVYMTFDPTKQTAALPGSGVTLQTSSTNAVSVFPGTAPSGTTGLCLSPVDCCNKVQAALNLPYALSPVLQGCPTTSTNSFACVADPGVNAQTCANSSDCQYLAVSQQKNQNYWSCQPYSASMGTNNVAFMGNSACGSVAAQLNSPFLGFVCDPSLGVLTCKQGQTGCQPATSAEASNPFPFISVNAMDPLQNPFSPACINRTSDCTNAPANCSFGTTGGTGCVSCPGPACTDDPNSTYSCTADALAGVQCKIDAGSTLTLQAACLASGGQSVCGCGCVVQGQACVNGQVVGAPCDTPIPAYKNLPLSYVCSAGGMMQSSMRWQPNMQDLTQSQCISNVPVYGSSNQVKQYLAPAQGNPCPQTSDGLTPTSTTSGYVWFRNDSALVNQTEYACPFDVYEACHGSTPNAPPVPEGNDMYCSFNAFSGTNMQAGLNLSSAMCNMTLMNIADANNANVPFCLSYLRGGSAPDVVLTGCVDAGAPGSVTSSTVVKDVVDPGNYCGQCSQSGPGINLCPLAPQSFTTLSGCKTAQEWKQFLSSDNSYQDVLGAYNSLMQSQTVDMLAVSLYAGLQGSSETPFQTAAQCQQPPAVQANGTLGYCYSASASSPGQCNSNLFPPC